MKTIYKSILTLSFGLVSLGMMAQTQDTILTRQVMLERDYNPTLNEATKINTEPNIYTPNIQSASSAKYLDQAPRLNIGATRLGEVASGDIMTDVPFSKQRFYLNFGAGSHGILDGAIGVRAVDARNDKLDIFATHSSMSGDVKNTHSDFLYKETKAKFAHTKANIKYQHKFEPSTLNIGASYQNMGYNYYGDPFLKASDLSDLGSEITNNLLDWLDHKTKQKVDVISFNAGLKSSDANEGLLKYEANIGYANFNTKYEVKGLKGNIIAADVNFFTALGAGNIGVAGQILNQSLSNTNASNLFSATVNPYYRVEGLNWDLTIGANVAFADQEKSKFAIAPNIKAQFHISDVNTLYASATGGVNNNTFLDILQENRYAAVNNIVGYSRTPFDLQVGFKSGVVPNLEFEIFGGYKQVKDDHLYYASSGSLIDESQSVNYFWGNLSAPLYAKVSTGHLGGLVKTKLIPKTTLTAKAVAYFYNMGDELTALGIDKVLGKPTFTAEISADIKPIDKLTLSISYLLMTGRKGASVLLGQKQAASDEQSLINENGNTSILNFSKEKMKAVSELNVRAEYEIVKQFSVFARINNLLDQQYEYQLGYSALGMNVLGGISVKF